MNPLSYKSSRLVLTSLVETGLRAQGICGNCEKLMGKQTLWSKTKGIAIRIWQGPLKHLAQVSFKHTVSIYLFPT